MSAVTPARRAALEVMRAVRRGVLADEALNRAAATLDARDRAWLHELAFGVLRLRGRLDYRIGLLSRRPLPKLDADVLDVLRLGAYQILEMDGVPAYAAVSQSVDLAREAAGGGAAGFVNGLLQGLRRSAASQTFPPETEPERHLATWGSHPDWLVRRWIARYGVSGATALTEANNTRPALYLRALGETAAVVEALREAGVATEPVPWAPAALRVVSGSVQTALAAAPVIAQDPAAGLVATYGDDPVADTVLDLAAAPGGKALAFARPWWEHEAVADDVVARRQRANARFVAAADVSYPRMRRLRDNVLRLAAPAPQGTGDARTAAVVADGRTPCFRPAPLVLLDAPCTGTGTLRRHPDGRWRLRPRDIGKLAGLQAQLLDSAATCVTPRGLLVYSTCSLEPEENEEQVAAFLERHPSFRIEPVRGADESLLHEDGSLRVLPHVHGVDGAYMVRLRRS